MKNTAIYRALILLFFLALTGIPAAAQQTFTPEPPRPPNRVCDLAFSPDGKWLLISRGDGGVQIWDVETAVLLHTLDSGNPYNCAYSDFMPDGKSIITWQPGNLGELDGITIVWDIETGEAIRRFTGTAILSDDQSLLFLQPPDTLPQLWDMATGQMVRSFDHIMRFMGSSRISPDHTRLLSYTWPLRYPELWDLTTGELLFSFPEGKGWFPWFEFLPDSQHALVFYEPDGLVLWNLDTLTQERVFPERAIGSTLWQSDDEQMLLTGYDDGFFLTWDVMSGELLQETPLTPPIPYDAITGSQLSNDGRSFLIELRQGIVQLWDVETGTLKHQFNPPADSAVDWTQTRTQTAFSADNRYALVGYSNEAVHLWDTETGMEIRTYRLPE